MSTLQDYSPSFFNSRRETQDDNPLRFELGWKDVASGLVKIAMGYGLLMGCIALAVGLVAAIVSSEMVLQNAPPSRGGNDLTMVWVTQIGGAAVSLGTLFACIWILTGKVRCAMHAPERAGARWLIFLCMIGVVSGPVVSVALNASYVARAYDNPQRFMKDTAEKQREMRVDLADLIGPTISFVTTVLFVLFIRSIGSCFNHSLTVAFADTYLALSAMLIGISIYLMFDTSLIRGAPVIALGIAGAWFFSLFGYLFLMLFARVMILSELRKVKSPLEA